MGSFVEESKKKMVIGRVDFSRDENSRCAPAELQVRGGGGSAAAVFGILHRVRLCPSTLTTAVRLNFRPQNFSEVESETVDWTDDM